MRKYYDFKEISRQDPDKIVSAVKVWMRTRGKLEKEINAYEQEATSGDYENLIKVSRAMADKLNSEARNMNDD